MTRDEAVARAAELFDGIAADALAASEAVVRGHGGTDEEVQIELTRVRAEIAQTRRHALEALVALIETGTARVH